MLHALKMTECKQLIHTFAFHARTGRALGHREARVRQKRFNDPRSRGQKTFTSEDLAPCASVGGKKADAILTGSGTILADNPLFTVRQVKDFEGKRRWLAILYLAQARAAKL